MQFFEAQKRFEQSKSKGPTSQYIRDILVNYGDHGRRINLPERSSRMYQEGVDYRRKEKLHYQSLEDELQKTKVELQKERQKAMKFAQFIAQLQFPDGEETDDPSSGGPRYHNIGGDRGDRVLPAADHPREDDTDVRKPAVTISSTEAKEEDEPTDARANRPRRHDAKQLAGQEGSTDGSQRADAGRAPPDPTDGAEPDMGGPPDQHGAEE